MVGFGGKTHCLPAEPFAWSYIPILKGNSVLLLVGDTVACRVLASHKEVLCSTPNMAKNKDKIFPSEK